MSSRPLSGETPSREVQLFRARPGLERGVVPLQSADSRRRESRMNLRGEGLRRFWREWYAGDMDLAELYQYRIHAAWRIMREICWLRGLLQERKQPLSETGHVDPSPWVNGFNFFNRLSGVRAVDVLCTDHTLPLLPPDIPNDYLIGEGSIDSYQPREDPDLAAWCDLVKIVASRLNIDKTEHGRYGLAGLTDPNYARAAMVTLKELIDYENMLVRIAFDKIRDGGMREAEKWLMGDQQLETSETEVVLAMAREHAKRLAGLDDREGFKAMILARMEGELDRLAEAGDSGRGRAFVLKEMFRIAAHESSDHEEDDLDDMNDVVQATHKQVRADNRKKLLTEPELPE